MAEEKETNFKVTDRRKFNADGSPREQSGEPSTAPSNSEQVATEIEQPLPDEAAAGNVVSFPGETSRKQKQAAAESSLKSASPKSAAPKSASPEAEREAGDLAEREASIKAAASAAEQAYNQTKTARAAHLPEPSFLSLTDMLAGEAAMCLGLAQTPDGSKLPVDLEAARTMIDMLGMLEQKTQGNLHPDESGVLENVLAYLRMQFVALSRNQ